MSGLLLFLSLWAVAAPRDAEADSDPSLDLLDDVPAAYDPRAASAARLRAMLGAHGEGPPLTRNEVLAGLDARHPKVRSAMEQVRAASGDARSALGGLDPQLMLGGKSQVGGYYNYTTADAAVMWEGGPVQAWTGWRLGVDQGDGSLPDYHGELKTLGGGEVRIGASVALLQGLLLHPSLVAPQVAGFEVDVATAQERAVRVLLRQKATASWAKWVATGRKLALEQALLDVAKARGVAVQTRIQLGDLAAIEDVRNRQILAERRAAVAEARGAFLGATYQLALYLRDAEGRGVLAPASRLPDRVAAPQGAAAFSTDPLVLARSEHPALQALASSLEARQLEARQARFDRLPELRVEIEHAVDLPRNGDDPTLAPPSTMVGLKAKVPFANVKDRGKAESTQAKADKAQAEVEWLEEQVLADVSAALATEEAALQAWRAAALTVELALQLQDAEQRRFDAGDIDLLRLWQVEQGTAKAISTEITEWMRYQMAVADLEAAVGAPLE